jgi:small subunit ribosomal protein S6e
MVLKLNISDKGKAWKLEFEHGEALSGKNVGDKINGKELKHELEGYELEITGGSDIAGFPLSKDVEGIGLKGVLLTKGWGMHDTRKGVRLRKTVRGKTISETSVQINMRIIKHGHKKLEEIFPEQVKKEVKEEKKEEVKEGS